MECTGLFVAENDLFEQHRDEWLRSHPGEYVAIQGGVVAEGFFCTYAEAFRAGLRRFGVSRYFLVKQILASDPIYFIP
jgi:hypothetical protein